MKYSRSFHWIMVSAWFPNTPLQANVSPLEVGIFIIKNLLPCHLVSASKVRWPELSQLSLCSEFDKENSIEFSLISLLLIHFTTVAMPLLFHGPHVTLIMWHTVMWPSVTPLWHCDKVTWYSPTLHLVVISPIRKEKEKKRNINNNLAVLPSHDILASHSSTAPKSPNGSFDYI